MPETKLLPCPFCGYDAELTTDYYGNGTDYCCVFCTNCGAGTAILSKQPVYDATDIVIKNWNRRANPKDEAWQCQGNIGG